MNRTVTPRPVVIDTDPGLDDAIALWLALASAELDVVAILATAGNADLSRTSANARSLVALAGRQVPVHDGADRPLAGARTDAVRVRVADALGSIGLPPGVTAAPGHAADILRAILRQASEPITLVGIGPVTNLALALATEPAIAPAVAEIVLMAGAAGSGNVTEHAEFNASIDPEALAVILSAGPTVTFATLDLTAQALITATDLGRWRARDGGRCLRIAADLVSAMPARPHHPDRGRPVHDACAIAWLLRPDLFTHATCHARVVLDGPERGRTVFSPPNGEHPPNARMLETVDRSGLVDLLSDRLALLP